MGDIIDLMHEVLALLKETPGMTDTEIATHLGEDPFRISLLLVQLESKGLIREDK
jgi:DNA-binding MarR family transcriptional regulator